MSLTTSAYLSRSQYFVAVAGATGKLGSQISKVLLSQQYRSFFTQVFLLVRNPESPIAKEFQSLGGELIHVDFTTTNPEDLTDLLKRRGVDVVINALGTFDYEAKTKLLEAIIPLAKNLLLYIPSEFGVDHRFNGFEHNMWDDKRQHILKAREAGNGKMKVVAIYAGIFMEQGIIPWYGFNLDKGEISVLGSPDTRFSFTSINDIAKATVQTTLQALTSPSEFADEVRIAGSTTSWSEIRDIFSKASGHEIKITVEGSDVQGYKHELEEKYKGKDNAVGYIRLLMAEGKLDLTLDSQNELINPGEKYWKWKTLGSYAREVKGRPPVPNM